MPAGKKTAAKPEKPAGAVDVRPAPAAAEPVRAGGWIDRRDGRGWVLEEE